MAVTRRGLVVIACVVLSAAAATAQPSPAPTDPLEEGRGPDVETAVTGAPEEEEESIGLLQRSLGNTAVGRALDDAGIQVGGLMEGSYTYSDSSPPGGIITGRLFDLEHEDPTLNQVLLFAERQTDANQPWDLGFRLELLYGADARFTASNGLFDHDGFEDGPENQFDITQAYLEIVIPVGRGLKTKIGKFITPLGYELVNPSGNAFYSHSFLFNIVPFAHTGILATYEVADGVAVSAGISRGWDQALEDNNDAIDAIGSVTWSLSDQTEGALSLTVGPEQPGNSGRYRTAVDVYVSHQVSDRLTVAVDAGYVADARAAQDGGTSHVYGVAGYAGYELNDIFTANARVEWFNDTSRVDGFDSTAYEVTLGLSIRPFPDDSIGSNLTVRPELRYDYADESVFDDGTDHDQFTAAIDLIFVF